MEPVVGKFHGAEIVEIPPASQGMTALVGLNILEQLDVGRYEPESGERRHLEIEALRLAWTLRNRHIADPDFAPIPVSRMLSTDTARRLASLVAVDHALPGPAVAGAGSDTVYLSVVDRNRLAVSFINSLYHPFGSGIVEPKTGIVLQNRGAGFVTDPSHPNCIGPGKRPLHTLMPAMCRRNGKVSLSFGVMGGSYQPMGHMAVLVNRLVYGMDSQEALDFARSYPQRARRNRARGACVHRRGARSQGPSRRAQRGAPGRRSDRRNRLGPGGRSSAPPIRARTEWRSATDPYNGGSGVFLRQLLELALHVAQLILDRLDGAGGGARLGVPPAALPLSPWPRTD